jgi:pyridinium-3,5-bisthiocarboxylic acid mononucleotide nickel chelatase
MSGLSVVVRTPSGLSGDMLLSGLSRLAAVSEAELGALTDAIGVPALANAVRIVPHAVGGVSGWQAEVSLPHEHHHRSYKAIVELIKACALAAPAKELAASAFTILAEAEARVHGIATEAVHFHEVGALDSLLDICLSSALLAKIAPVNLYCSPLPIADGAIRCEHGLLASPAPAVQEMLAGVPVYGVDAEGETVTPTALALLKAAKAKFGKWPDCTVVGQARVYGGKTFANLPNGALFFAVQE